MGEEKVPSLQMYMAEKIYLESILIGNDAIGASMDVGQHFSERNVNLDQMFQVRASD
jgi:hypothetical protein